MLKLSGAGYEQIRHHAEEIYPRECCGILIGSFDGRDRTVQSVVRCTNVAAGPQQTTYEIGPRELIGAQREARKRGLEIVGFYHSHPDHGAQPSPTDLKRAHWIGCSYVIAGISGGRAGKTKSFLLAGRLEEYKHFEEEKVVLLPAK
jgi:proteasome lid subunit RPN8/RPN11